MSRSFPSSYHSTRHGSIARCFTAPLFLVVFTLFCCPSFADSTNAPKNRIYAFIGQYTTVSMGESAKAFRADYEKNYPVAVAYDRDLMKLGYGFHMGGEVGLLNRFGISSSAEAWSGVVIRHEGITSRERITISLSLTVGVSLISKAIGAEYDREVSRRGNAIFLFYLGPEIALSLPGLRPWEIVYRLHHRSGANGTLGGMSEGHNANTIGLRYRF